jgi:serine/threonine protein kinase
MTATTDAAVAMDLVPTSILDHEVISGGFGDVRFETRLGMRVAIKTSREVGSTMQHEASILSRLDHPFIPTLVSWTTHEMVMGDHGRQSLTEVLQEKQLQRTAYDRIAWCIASAVAYMHRLCIHHADIKCDNVVVDSLGDPMLVDFNLSQHSPTGVSTVRCGSLHYVPPEIFNVHSQWNAFYADVWSFSILYFTILYGHLPFDDTRGVFAQYEMLHPDHGSIQSLRTVWLPLRICDRGDMSKMHEVTLDSMMQPNPEQRPSMASIQRMLYCIRCGRQV